MPAIFTKLDKIKPIYDLTYKALMILCKLLLIGDILITSMAVTGRYVPFVPDPSWTEEIVLTLMAYMAVISAALAIRKGAHIRMTAFDRYLPKTLIKVLDVIADLFVMAFGFVMLVVGFKYASSIGAKGFYISLPKLSKFWMYFPIPVAGFAMIVFELESIYNHIKSFFVTDKEEAK
ncbi:MAG: TRAP transporter small permease [Lachnospiraceae bacterium]|nr:TRAP transporter small permease [Lachnospiraceae bacterium]